MQKYYYELVLPRLIYQQLNDDDEFKNISTLGIEEFSMVEKEVDDLLGERSYSGGDLPESVIDEVVNFQDNTLDGHVKIYFDEEEDIKSYISLIKLKYNKDLKYTKKEYEDWNESWKESYKPIEIDSENILIPSWSDEADFNFKTIVKIYPGMGFGTGSHETTYLCLKLLVDNISMKSVNSCMDYGCGSGILAIFANKIKTLKTTDYYDIDKEALDNTQVNLDLNGLKHNYQLLLPNDKSKFSGGYDLVFANILQNVLLSESEQISKISNKYLIISGLLNGQEDEVLRKYDAFTMTNILRKNDWCALLLERK
jgi:ribosomal protein L11 methyltransferase